MLPILGGNLDDIFILSCKYIQRNWDCISSSAVNDLSLGLEVPLRIENFLNLRLIFEDCEKIILFLIRFTLKDAIVNLNKPQLDCHLNSNFAVSEREKLMWLGVSDVPGRLVFRRIWWAFLEVKTAYLAWSHGLMYFLLNRAYGVS